MTVSQTTKQPLVWVLLGQKAGDNNQVLALAEQLPWPFQCKNFDYRPFEIVTNRLLGVTLAGVDRKRSSELSAPWPDLVITAGRRNEPVARWIKRQSGGKTRLVHMGRPWVTGLLGQHWWSFAGESNRDSVSQTDIQYVIGRQIPGGWSIGMGPTISIDWKASSGEKVTLPVGLGITRTVRWNGRPWKLRFEPQYSIVRPDEIGVEWNFRIQIAPIIDNPFD